MRILDRVWTKIVCIALCFIIILSWTHVVCAKGNQTQSATLAVDGVKPYATLQVKSGKKATVTFAVIPTTSMKGKKLTIRFDRLVWLAKNYQGDRYKVLEKGRSLKVIWKKNSRKVGKLRVGFSEGKYMTVVVKIRKGIG